MMKPIYSTAESSPIAKALFTPSPWMMVGNQTWKGVHAACRAEMLHDERQKTFQSPDAREYRARKSVIQGGSGRRVRCAGQRLLRGGTHIDTVTDTVKTFLCRPRGAIIGAG
jgi:hypothetical protein